MIVAVSSRAANSAWVRYEADQGLLHQSNFRDFAVIPVRLEPCNLPSGLEAHSAIDALDGDMDDAEAARLLRSIHGMQDLSPPEEVKRQAIQYVSRLAHDPQSDLVAVKVPIFYVTCGWREHANEVTLRTAVGRELLRQGCHLVSDAEDHPHLLADRIKSILQGCSGQIVLLPRRANAPRWNDPEYRYLQREIEWGKTLGLPQWFVTEQGLRLPNGMASKSLVLDVAKLGARERGHAGPLTRWAAEIAEEAPAPAHPDFVMVASDYRDRVIKEHVLRHIEQVTGLPCLKGSDFGRQVPSRKIELALRHAALVVANVVSGLNATNHPAVNWNSCIEAGIAMGAGRHLHIIAWRGPRENWRLDQHLPFMIRHNSIETYRDDPHLLALIHRLARPFRRRILVPEGPD